MCVFRATSTFLHFIESFNDISTYAVVGKEA